MKIGVTGHQQREGIDWRWVRSRIDRYLAGKSIIFGYSSLAAGADQIFADAVLDAGGTLIAVVPMEDYPSQFKDEPLREYSRLLAKAQIVQLRSRKPDEGAFLDAGKWIARNVDCLVTVWDGEDAAGRGGTADIVVYAMALGRQVHHIDPIKRKTADI
ncbi:hypothetical protein [Novosphingobium sp. ES2-1]|uniref:hypothetical protein n=2 Tax=unclassified Novosphingobium TaxID=2644732 RepID=UPI00187E8A3F|nr:hypothetical protein [Novosphingobium sp. ES2-1]QOV96588.1 hypothetical protein IM701_21325 [Novosphingobium sp. ES2-1]